MKRLLLLLVTALPMAAHDFWVEPSSFRPARGEAITASLRVGENFDGELVERDGIELIDRGAVTVIAYRSNAFGTVSLPRAKFDAYLREEGLRVTPRTSGMQRERFARFAKAIVGNGSPDAAGALGWRFEVVPLSGSRFQVLYEGKPLRDALVVATSKELQHLDARTDGNGVVSLALTNGVWLVNSVHMIPAPPASGFDWESLWASLTLQR
jgi:uncharacterized GH25 family protein